MIFLSERNKKYLLKIARMTLINYLDNGKIPEIETRDKQLNQKFGLFVTLTEGGKLQGCIGQFEPEKPLYKMAQEKVIDAAFNDPRFESLKKKKLKEIKIEISVISALHKIDNWENIKLGEHGVLIKKGSRCATFLPQVALETGWSKEQFLENLCLHKAGLSADSYKDPSTQIYIYSVKVFKED